MSDIFWQRLSYISGLGAIGVFFGLAAFFSGIEVKDLDLWLHLKTGQIITAVHNVPSTDVLSATIAGKPWVNHEWLFQVIVHHVHKFFSFDGLILMQQVVVVLTFVLLLFLVYNRDRQWLIVFTLLLVLLVYQSRFTIRPDIFSLLFFVMYIQILSSCINRRWFLPALFFIQVAWTNMHGYFFFGPLLMAIALLGEGIKRTVPLPSEWNKVARLTDGEFHRLGLAGIVVLLACCINPGGVKGALYPLHVFGQIGGESKVFFEHITELQRPISWGSVWTTMHFPYKFLILLSGMSFIFNRRRVDVGVFLVWVIFLIFSLAAVRNMVYFAVAAFLVCHVNILQLAYEDVVPIRFTHPRFKYITGIFMKIGLLVWMLNTGLAVTANGYFDFDVYQRKSEFGGVSKRSFPYKAVDFLVNNNIKGNFFNDFNSGAYLVGRVYPNIKVFIDGRTEVYGASFFQLYQKIWKEGDLKVFRDMEEKYNITGAFLNNNNQEIPRKVLIMFHRMPGWKAVYFDEDAVIFLKETPANKAWIAKFAVNWNKWDPKPMDLQKLGTRRIDPFPYTSRAYVLEILGFQGPALKEAALALKVDPDDALAYRITGRIYGQRKNYRKAFENYRLAAMLAPGDRPSRLGLAWSYEHMGNNRGALLQYQRLLADKPKDVKIAGKVEKLKKLLKI